MVLGKGYAVRDLKYADLLLDRPYIELESSIRTYELYPIVRAFVANMERVVALIRLPPHLVYWFQLIQLFQNIARLKLTGKVVRDDTKPRDERIESDVDKDVNVQIHNTVKAFAEERLVWRDAWNQGTRNIAALNEELFDHFSPAIDALFFGVVIGTWTAFETLTTDLWECAVNNGPKKWANNVVEVQRKTLLKSEGAKGSKDQEKMIAISVLSHFGYDLRNKMGSLLRQEEKVDFQTFDNIKKVYEATFNRNDIDIIFDVPSIKKYQALEAVRNLVVHRASKVDAKFKTKIKGFPLFANLSIGDQLSLDGHMVKELADPIIRLGCELILYIDRKMIEANPVPDHDWII